MTLRPADEVRRAWRFWCDQCGELGRCEFTNRDDEVAAGIRYIQKHQGHGMGGFVTPVAVKGCDSYPPETGSEVQQTDGHE